MSVKSVIVIATASALSALNVAAAPSQSQAYVMVAGVMMCFVCGIASWFAFDAFKD